MILALAAAASVAVAPQWIEDFQTLDPARWDIQLYSFPANGCDMGADQVKAANGTLNLSVSLLDTPHEGKICKAGEVGSRRFFQYGLFQVRMALPAVRGGVAAFYLMNQWQPEKWEHKEIDFEFLGNKPDQVQLTNHDFQKGGTDWKSAVTQAKLGFDFAAAAHDYAILWTPKSVRWYVDGRLLHEEKQYVPHEPLQIRANIYLGAPDEPGVAAWLGPIDKRTVPATATYSNLRYFPLDALPPEFKPD
ncbi:MAG: family 16 glycosylhydrolase [Sphingomonas bacterium]